MDSNPKPQLCRTSSTRHQDSCITLLDDQAPPLSPVDYNESRRSEEPTSSKLTEKSGQPEVAADVYNINGNVILTPMKDMGSFRVESEKYNVAQRLKNVECKMVLLAEQNEKIMQQQKEILEMLSLRQRSTGTREQEPINFSTPLVQVDDVLAHEKWKRIKYAQDRQLYANELVRDLASKVFFGDDVLIRSNVLKADPTKKQMCLDPSKLMRIHEIVKRAVGVAPMNFIAMWEDSLKSLQDRCKNLRKGATRMATSSELHNDASFEL